MTSPVRVASAATSSKRCGCRGTTTSNGGVVVVVDVAIAFAHAARIATSSPSRVLAQSTVARRPSIPSRKRRPSSRCVFGTSTSNFMLPVTTKRGALGGLGRDRRETARVVARLREHASECAHARSHQCGPSQRGAQRARRHARVRDDHRNALIDRTTHEPRPDLRLHDDADQRSPVTQEARHRER